MQMLSLFAVVAALYFAVEYGHEVEQMFGIEVAIEGIAGFIMIFLGALLVISVAAHLLRAVFRFAGYRIVFYHPVEQIGIIRFRTAAEAVQVGVED